MTFTTTSDLIEFIQNTHTMFGERKIDHAAECIAKFEAKINKTPAMIGGNFYARTNEEHGGIDTIITINKIDGAWQYVERRMMLML